MHLCLFASSLVILLGGLLAFSDEGDVFLVYFGWLNGFVGLLRCVLGFF